MHGLGEKLTDLARSVNRELVFLRQFIHAQNRNDVFQFLVLLQNTLHPLGHVVVLFTHNQGVKLTRRRVERIYRWINTQGCDISRQGYS